jgi:parallel beta-helix repeat protein
LKPASDDTTNVQGALIDANSGDVVCFGAGKFSFTDQLSLATANVTLRGVSGTILDFSGQTMGANAIEVTANDDTVDTLDLQNPKGDGIRATQVQGVTIRNARVEWTNGGNTNNGGYGIYPVTSSKVLIENCYASGASDTGIYVGQSTQIVVRNNEATGNVAGIEIENSTDAEVYGNHSHDNAAGILIFNLPGLTVKDGKRANIHDNIVESNNGTNFAADGNIVHDVPSGTGMFVLAADHNEIHGNTVKSNQTVGVAILSWYVALRDAEGKADPAFDWYPEGNFVHDNSLSDNGATPKDRGSLIASIVGVTTLPDIGWDGVVDWQKVYGNDAGTAPDGGTSLSAVPAGLRNCFKSNGTSTFMDLDLADNGKNKSSDLAPFDCAQPTLAPIAP